LNLCGVDLTRARNLTPAQLAEAVGDRATALPPGLEVPKSWLRSTLDLIEEQASVAGPATSKLDVVEARAKGSKTSRVSWLIGGPLQTARLEKRSSIRVCRDRTDPTKRVRFAPLASCSASLERNCRKFCTFSKQRAVATTNFRHCSKVIPASRI
jgi:hypothetical protein